MKKEAIELPYYIIELDNTKALGAFSSADKFSTSLELTDGNYYFKPKAFLILET